MSIANKTSWVEKIDLSSGVYIYGAGELGLLALDYFEASAVKVLGFLDKTKSGYVKGFTGTEYCIYKAEQLPNSIRLDAVVAIAIATTAVTPISTMLSVLGWVNVVPFYCLTREKNVGHPLRNGWLIGSMTNSEREKVAVIYNNWADNASIKHYEMFLAWHTDYTELESEAYPIVIEQRYVIKPLLDFLALRKKVFLDIGSHSGGAVKRISEALIEFDEYVLVEPDFESRKFLEQLEAKLTADGKRVSIIEDVLGTSSAILPFKEELGYCSQIWDESDTLRKVNTIDQLKLCPDLIKIHTEGSEFDIIKGGVSTIREHRPAIVYSVYHTRNGFCHDLIETMKLINDYSWYFRLHSYQGTGAFVYGIPNK